MSAKPSVLFVCVSNSGKSQIAAALMRQEVGSAVEVHSAGTTPKGDLNPLSVQSLNEVDASTAGEYPKAIDPTVLARMDVVVTLGAEALSPRIDGPDYERWITDEPSERGIDGIQRMRLIRDDISQRVHHLSGRLLREKTSDGSPEKE